MDISPENLMRVKRQCEEADAKDRARIARVAAMNNISPRRPAVYETPEPERGGNAIGAMIILAIGFATGVALAAVVL